MDVEISPEPSPDERRALVRGLEELPEREQDGDVGAWWRAGVRENVSDDA